MPLIYAKGESAEWCDVLRWSQRAIGLADGDPSKGNFIIGSPLALAFTPAPAGVLTQLPGDGNQMALTVDDGASVPVVGAVSPRVRWLPTTSGEPTRCHRSCVGRVKGAPSKCSWVTVSSTVRRRSLVS